MMPSATVVCMRAYKRCSVRLYSQLLKVVDVLFHLCYLFTYISIQHVVHIRYCSHCLTVTYQVLLEEQKLFPCPDHLSLPPDL